jgi:hypothetical protein
MVKIKIPKSIGSFLDVAVQQGKIQKMNNLGLCMHTQRPMAYGIGTLALTMYLLGIVFLMHFSVADYYIFGSDPTGFSTETLGLILCTAAVLFAGYAAFRRGDIAVSIRRQLRR